LETGFGLTESLVMTLIQWIFDATKDFSSTILEIMKTVVFSAHLPNREQHFLTCHAITQIVIIVRFLVCCSIDSSIYLIGLPSVESCLPTTCPIGSGVPTDDVVCRLCLSGTYSSTNGVIRTCEPCQLGYSSDLGSSSCFACSAGTYNNAIQTSCTSCPQGKFQNVSGMSFCFDCPFNLGTASSGSSSSYFCQSCKIGYGIVADEGCAACSPGRFSNSTGSSCSNCTLGRVSRQLASSSCSICPAGKYSDFDGQLECQDCPKGKWSSVEGQTNSNQCLECPAGRFSSSTGLDNSDQCITCPSGRFNPKTGSPDSSDCKACPNSPGVSCPDGTIVPRVYPGYWSDGVQVYECIPSYACTGGVFGTANGSSNSSLCSCASGYTASICASCDEGFFRLYGLCRKCLTKAVRWIIFAVLALLLTFIAWKSMNSTVDIPPTIKICLFWLQILSLYPSLFDGWPSELKFIFDIAAFFNFEIGYFGFGCDISKTFYGLMSFKLASPLLFWLAIFLIEYAIRRRATLSQARRILSHVLYVTNFLSVQLFSTLFQVFNCQERVDGNFALLSDPTELCFTSQWYSFFGLDLFFFLLYFGALPLFVWRKYVSCNRDPQSKEFKQLFGPLMAPYRSGKEGHEVYRLFFKLCFVIIRDVIRTSRMSKSTLLALLFAWQIWLESGLNLYNIDEMNRVSMLYVCLLVF
jgi:hypothetical protein